jgi:hypothetical protein
MSLLCSSLVVKTPIASQALDFARAAFAECSVPCLLCHLR